MLSVALYYFFLFFFVFLLRLLHLQLPVACFCCCCCSFSCCCVFISLSFRRNGSDVWQMYTRTAGRNTNHCCCLQNSENPINSFHCWRTIFCFFWKLIISFYLTLFKNTSVACHGAADRRRTSPLCEMLIRGFRQIFHFSIWPSILWKCSITLSTCSFPLNYEKSNAMDHSGDAILRHDSVNRTEEMVTVWKIWSI